MDLLLLAGGFAKRLRPFSRTIPKALLPIAGIPLIDYILDAVSNLPVERVVLSTNRRFEPHFRYWARGRDIEVVVEPALDESEKLGAVGGLVYAIRKADLTRDLLIIAADNLFNFDLRPLISEDFSVALYDVKNLEEARRFGVAILDGERLLDILEKPENPPSTLISTGIYFVPSHQLPLVEEYLKEGGDRDSLGKFISWACRQTRMRGIVFDGLWMDVGTPEAYLRADRTQEVAEWGRRILEKLLFSNGKG